MIGHKVETMHKAFILATVAICSALTDLSPVDADVTNKTMLKFFEETKAIGPYKAEEN